jgi:hypothetical protein
VNARKVPLWKEFFTQHVSKPALFLDRGHLDPVFQGPAQIDQPSPCMVIRLGCKDCADLLRPSLVVYALRAPPSLSKVVRRQRCSDILIIAISYEQLAHQTSFPLIRIPNRRDEAPDLGCARAWKLVHPSHDHFLRQKRDRCFIQVFVPEAPAAAQPKLYLPCPSPVNITRNEATHDLPTTLRFRAKSLFYDLSALSVTSSKDSVIVAEGREQGLGKPDQTV